MKSFSKKASAIVVRQLSEYQRWFDKHSDELRSDFVKTVVTCSRRRRCDNLHELAIELGALENLIAVEGVLELYQRSKQDRLSDSRSFEKLELACHYEFWETRCYFEFERNRLKRSAPGAIFEPLCNEPAKRLLPFALANEIDPWITTCERAIQVSEHRTKRLSTLGMLCAQARSGKSITSDAKAYDLDPFPDIFSVWHDLPALESALLEMCEVHVMNIVESDDSVLNSDIGHAPLNLIPYEVLMIYTIRSRLRLPTPDIEHPVLPFAPSQYKPLYFGVTDAILVQVQKEVERICREELKVSGETPKSWNPLSAARRFLGW